MSWTLVGNIKGPQGATGNTGSTGAGVPAGGAAGQLLAKLSNSDFDDHWVDPPSGAAWGGITGTLSSQTDLQAALNAKASTAQAVPAGGTTGQQLVKNSGTDYDTKWAAPAAVVAGSSTQIQYNSGGTLAGDAGLTYDATNKALTVGGATVTASAPVANLSQTWNAGAVTFTGFKLNVTDTASAAASLLADLQIGGASKFSVDKKGNLYLNNGSSGGTIYGANSTAVITFSYNGITLGLNGGAGAVNYSLGFGVSLATTFKYGFGTDTYGSSPDTALGRNAAGIVEINNGTAGTFRDLKLRNLYVQSGVLVKASFTVATLPSASTSGAGAEAYATDLASLTNGATATGGGTLKGTIVSNGTNWIVLG